MAPGIRGRGLGQRPAGQWSGAGKIQACLNGACDRPTAGFRLPY